MLFHVKGIFLVKVGKVLVLRVFGNAFILSEQEEYEEALLFAKRALTIGEALAAQLDTDDARREAEAMRNNLKIVEAYCKKS